ncbi:hypothetical protein D9M71_713890 [compost metagenome]
MDQGHGAGQARGGGHPLLVVVKQRPHVLLRQVAHLARVDLLLLEAHRRIAAVHLRRGLDEAALVAIAHVAREVVPHRFHAVAGDGEGIKAALLETGQAIAVVDRLHLQGAVPGRGLDLRRHGRRAVARIHRNAIAVGVALEHRHLAIGELVPVLLGSAGGDHE